MKRITFAAGACSAAVATALTFSGSVLAEPDDPAPAPDDTAGQAPSAAVEYQRLLSEGKSVQVVGAERGALLENCDVADTTEGAANTVLLKVDCGLNYP